MISGLDLSQALNIYGADLGLAQSEIEGAMPVRLAFDEAVNGFRAIAC